MRHNLNEFCPEVICRKILIEAPHVKNLKCDEAALAVMQFNSYKSTLKRSVFPNPFVWHVLFVYLLRFFSLFNNFSFLHLNLMVAIVILLFSDS